MVLIKDDSNEIAIFLFDQTNKLIKRKKIAKLTLFNLTNYGFD